MNTLSAEFLCEGGKYGRKGRRRKEERKRKEDRKQRKGGYAGMGEKTGINSFVTNGDADKKAGRGHGNGSTNAAHPETGTAGTAGTESGNDGRQTEKEISLGIPVLSEKDEKRPLTREERNAKRRERYAQKKAEEGKTVRKKKRTAKDETVFDVTPLLVTVFGVISAREGMEHWSLSQSEAKAIGDPLNKILADSEAFSELNNHSDSVALVVACATIFVPKIMVTVSKNKERKKEKTIEKRIIEGKTKRSDNNGNGENFTDGNVDMRRLCGSGSVCY